MTVTFKLPRAATSGNVPSSLVTGQIGIDEFTGKLFWRQNSGIVTPFPLLAPANTILANNTGSSAAPTWLTPSQGLTLLGAAPVASPTLTGTINLSGTVVWTGAFVDKAYVVSTPTTGTTVTLALTTGVQIIAGSSTLALLTIAFPASPPDGLRFEVASVVAVTALTCSASGTTIKNAPTTLSAGGGFEYLYVSSGTTWYRIR